MALELCLKLLIVSVLHLKHTLVAVTTKLCILLNNQTNMDCYFIIDLLSMCALSLSRSKTDGNKVNTRIFI